MDLAFLGLSLGFFEQERRGKLKVFFGATAGVGKTCAMLEAAQELKRRGAEVVVGWVDTDGRKETEALLEGLEVLPPREIEHRGIRLREFDLDAVLTRRPAVVLVDDLAHTNAPGSRHAKRWQDVEELLAAGLDVYTTVEVQHLESLNDLVGQITDMVVRETLPDSVQGIAETWPVAERILLAVSSGPGSQRLVRAARRLAGRLRAEWLVVYVETPAETRLPEQDRDRVWQTLRLAEKLGAETEVLSGERPADAILQYARRRNVSKIVVGKPVHPRWRDALFGSVRDELERNSGGIDIYVISGEEGEGSSIRKAVE